MLISHIFKIFIEESYISVKKKTNANSFAFLSTFSHKAAQICFSFLEEFALVAHLWIWRQTL